MKTPNSLKKLIQGWASRPGRIFFIDGLGALLTATLLIAIVIPLRNEFGLPQNELFTLSAAAFILSIFSFSCALVRSNKWRLLLTVVYIANCIYCLCTVVLLMNSFNSVTLLGFAYFGGELFIILILVYLEIMITRIEVKVVRWDLTGRNKQPSLRVTWCETILCVRTPLSSAIIYRDGLFTWDFCGL